MNLYNTPMMPSPFDDSATARQMRMGLLQDDGIADRNAVAVLSRVFAGLLFDDLCESLSDMEQVFGVCKRIAQLQEEGDAKKALLYICIQYDGMLQPLPEPIWWIVGNSGLVESFVAGFSDCLNGFTRKLAVLENHNEHKEESVC